MHEFPDVRQLTPEERTEFRILLEQEEAEVSLRRRFLHERLDLVREERVRRVRRRLAAGSTSSPPEPAPDLRGRQLFTGAAEVPGGLLPELPDVRVLDDNELRELLHSLKALEDDVSLHRRVLHQRIDLLRRLEQSSP